MRFRASNRLSRERSGHTPHFVPVREMVRHYFGNPIRGQLQPAGVRGLEFYIYDKEEGPFRLEVAQIEAIRTRLGSE